MCRRYILPAFLIIAAFLVQGCAPMVMCTVETIVLPDYTCRRAMKLTAYPNPNYPGQRPRLGDYYQFPPAELYETYVAQPDSAVFAGIFNSYENIPPDLVRPTPGSTRLSTNSFSFQVIDMILVVLADFDETINDIVQSKEDGQAALAEFVRLVVPEVMAVLNARYGQKFDLSRLELWLNNDLPAKLQRVYGGAWDIHSNKRSGVTSPGELIELYIYLSEEAKKEGLELAPLGTPNLEQENIRRLKEFGAKKALELCPPRQPGGAQLSADMLSGSAGDELLGALQKAVTARHGSINNYINKINTLIPRAFGTFLTGTAVPIFMLPEVSYQYRLRVPGVVLQTNAVRDVNGDMLWTFTDSDLALTGQSMWARTLFVREADTSALGVRGFPSTFGEVERLFSLCVAPDGRPRDDLLDALQNGVEARSLAPVEALAANTVAPDSPAARGVLELLARYRNQAAQPQIAPQQPAPQPQAQQQIQQQQPQPQQRAPQPVPQAQPQPPPQAQPQPQPQRPPVSSNVTPAPVGGAAHETGNANPLAPIQPINIGDSQSTGSDWGIAPPPIPGSN
jgi:Vesicle coat complex COPII, subunit SEC24/subunit SFB2/subunit SFB3